MEDERLWLTAERGPEGSFYALTLVDREGSRCIGTVHPAGDRWHWKVRFVTQDGVMTDKGEADSAEQASENQFSALVSLAPDRFRRAA